MQEIKIRKVKQNTIYKLNELAKEKGLSREDFLREELEKIAFKNEIDDKEKEYKDLCKSVVEAITLNTKMLGAFMDEYIIDGEDAYNLVVDYPHKKSILENKLSYVNHKDINKFDTKDLLIRDVPTYVLNKVDEISNARNLSRNEFLNIYLRQLTYSNSLKLVDEKYKYMLEKSLGILDFNNRIFKIFYDENIVDISHFIEGSL